VARDRVFATYDDLRRIGMAVTGLLALIILVSALIVPRRERHGPFYGIERAIGAGEFVPYYQPIVDIKSGAIVGAEVLVRWRKHDGSLVLPTTFVPFLEPTDLILDMTRSIMQQASEEVGALLECRSHMYVAFNIAPRHLTGDLLIDDIGSIFVGGPISTSQIVLEITERYEIEDLAATRNLIAALQGLGCRVAIDDVGTGHNGLSYILKLGVDIIKIEKCSWMRSAEKPIRGRLSTRWWISPAICGCRSSPKAWRISSRSFTCATTGSVLRRASCSRLHCRVRHSSN
jgi:sensor c-di-GMP phosphodiesterase-like protein